MKKSLILPDLFNTHLRCDKIRVGHVRNLFFLYYSNE